MLHENEDELPKEGMGSGISTCIKQLLLSDVYSVLQADQPDFSSDLFRTMPTLKDKSGKGIVACSYAGYRHERGL